MKNQYIYHSGKILPLSRDNVDTDQIIPKQFLKSIKKSGFGANLFDAWRYEDEGYPGQDNDSRPTNDSFVLNQDKYKGADILISKKNFGCGSSREHAVWSLLDYGIKVVIAESFADIFYNNCFKNGILPIKVSADERDALLADAADSENPKLSIDLVSQTISRPNSVEISFEIDPFRKQCLLDGLDDIGLTMEKETSISQFEAGRKTDMPWL